MKIAIIGSGIAGLTTGYLLSRNHEVHLYEANDYVGGHTNTEDVEIQGKVYPVNTGFIVFNNWTYPNFIELMNQLEVEWEDSDMSFSVKNEKTGLEYNGHTLNTLFAQRSNIFNAKFLGMIQDILRFNKEATSEFLNHELDQVETLNQYLERKNYRRTFIENYIVPMGAAIWSSSEEMMMKFPVYFFIRFFHHHGMLSVDERPQWKTLKNGSRSYVPKIIDRFKERVYLNTPVQSVARFEDRVEITSNFGTETFDEVVFACHSDQALAMLKDPSQSEKDILSAIPYQENDVVLHIDDSVLPKKKLAWAAWNYHIPKQDGDRVAVTYDMNILQNFGDCPVTFCVSLNKNEDIDPAKIIKTFKYDHPTFTVEGSEAQLRHEEISGTNRTHYCGAYWFNGFHEDGVRSGLRVAAHFGEYLSEDNQPSDSILNQPIASKLAS